MRQWKEKERETNTVTEPKEKEEENDRNTGAGAVKQWWSSYLEGLPEPFDQIADLREDVTNEKGL